MSEPVAVAEPRGMLAVWHTRMGGRATWRQTVWGEFLSEYLGTFVLISFGCGVVAMAVAALNQSGRGTLIFQASGDWLLITFGWALAVTLGVYTAGGISGAHLNPAVTLALAVRRGFPWKHVPHYVLAQLAGAFTGALLVYAVYKDAIHSYENVHHITRGALNSVPTFSIFGTFPAGYFHGVGGPLIDQIAGTAFLVGLVFAVVDEFNTPPLSNLAPVVVGGIVAAIGMSYGANAGYAINPARDFGPRLVAWIEGYGGVALPGNFGNISNYWWIPIVGPLVGGVFGALVYDFFIHDVLVSRRPPSVEAVAHGRTVEEVPPTAPVAQ